jgi:hypothetical protein
MSGINLVAFGELRPGDVLDDGSIVTTFPESHPEGNGSDREVFVREHDGLTSPRRGYVHEPVSLARSRGIVAWETTCAHEISEGDRIMVGYGRVVYVTGVIHLDNKRRAFLFFDEQGRADGVKRVNHAHIMRATLS